VNILHFTTSRRRTCKRNYSANPASKHRGFCRVFSHTVTRQSLALLALLSLPITLVLADETKPAVADGRTLIEMKTSQGMIVLELNKKLAPRSVENFVNYVETGFYDGTIFHRVIDGFMIQGGGFTSEFKQKDTQPPIRNEANNGLKNKRYTIAMARTNAPHSATAQFFINTVDNDALDHTDTSARGWGYAVFGKVIEGFDVVDSISGVVTGAGGPFSRDAPRPTIMIEKMQKPAPLVEPTAEPAAQTQEGTATQ